MWAILSLATSVILLFGQVESCSISISAITAVFSPEIGGWLIRLGWSEENPDCNVQLEEEVNEGDAFKIMEKKLCKSSEYCYFKTSAQTCDNGKPKYTVMKFTSMCSECKFATFTFTVDSLLGDSDSIKCEYVLIMGKRTKNSNLKPPFEFQPCGKNRTCYDTGNVEGPGCYCPKGYLLNPETQLCEEPSERCPGGEPDIDLNLKVPDCVTPDDPVIIKWDVEPERQYEYSITDSSGAVVKKQTLPGVSDPSQGFDVTGKIATLTIPAGALGLDTYEVKVVDLNSESKFSEQKNFNVKAGCKTPLDLNINVNAGCDSDGIQKTDITWDVAADRSYSYQLTDSSGAAIKEGKGSGSGGGDFPVSSGKALVTTSLAPGNYKVTVKDLDAGDKDFYSEYEDFSVEECKQPHPFNLQVPDCVKSGELTIPISWDVKADRMYKYEVRGGSLFFNATVSGGQSSGDFVVSGDRGTLTLKSPGEWDVAIYEVTVTDLSSSIPSMTTDSFKVRKGCKTPLDLNINVTTGCDTDGVQKTDITWDVAADRSYSYQLTDSSGAAVKEGKGSGSGGGDFSVSSGKALVTTSLAPGNYRVTVKDLNAGDNDFYSEYEDFSVEECKQPHPFNLQVPNCVKSVEPTISISWDVAADRMYKYKVRGGSSLFTATVSGGQSSGDFVVSGGRGTLTLKSPGEWDVAIYKVTVTDLLSSIPSMTTDSFKVRKGCQPIVDLEIDASGICQDGESTAMISWKVESGRMYHYRVNSQGGQTVTEGTVSGSGSSNFPVENGRGKISMSIGPGDYTLTVQDLDAGVNDYHTESKDFSLADCVAIVTASCVSAGQNASVSFAPKPGQTYEYVVVVEDQPNPTPQVVLNGTLNTSGQSGQTMEYLLGSSDTLPAGRYVLAVRDKETGGAGYGRFLVNDRGGIGPDVKYTADPQHNGMYVCLDPVEEKDFTEGLTVKIGNNAEKSLSGEGYCFLQAYTGSESTLTMSVRKNGGVASTANIRYIGP